MIVGTPVDVGSYPAGVGKWGHRDLSGNLWEWLFDGSTPYTSATCDNCAPASSGGGTVMRGGSYYGLASYLRAAQRGSNGPNDHNGVLGGRCARTP